MQIVDGDEDMLGERCDMVCDFGWKCLLDVLFDVFDALGVDVDNA